MLWRTFNWYISGRSLCLLKGVRFYTELIDAIISRVQHTGRSIIPRNVENMGKERGGGGWKRMERIH